MDLPIASVIIPTFNGAHRIGRCLDALVAQAKGRPVEILVVDDGSTDETPLVVASRPDVSLLYQQNSGPAAARNRGALAARGELILFTDDDCEPVRDWLDAMLVPFSDPALVGVKGVYKTRQKAWVARFVQMEYEDKYRIMERHENIDFVDTYSAAFRRERFIELNGYDTSFPVACAEDIELSYRMSARGWAMKFLPNAVVFHIHPGSLVSYLRKKYKFAFWRVHAVRKNPAKGVKDSHTPQLMKLQLLFWPALLWTALLDYIGHSKTSYTLLLLAIFFLSTLPFSLRAGRKDPIVGLISPFMLLARSGAQCLGVISGVIYTHRYFRKRLLEGER